MDEKLLVTAWFYLKGKENKCSNQDKKAPEKRVEYFQKLLDFGIPICVYVDQYHETYLGPVRHYPNLFIKTDIKKLEDLSTFQMMNDGEGCQLPASRNHEKDSKEYMVMQTAKTEFVSRAMKEESFSGKKYFGWIDFSIVHMFENQQEEARQRLLSLLLHPKKFQGLCIPTIRSLDEARHFMVQPSFLDQIYWRFAGSFFYGDVESVNLFCQTCEDNLRGFTKKYQRWVWEINYWLWLENQGKFSNFVMKNYDSDHNSSIFPKIFFLQ